MCDVVVVIAKSEPVLLGEVDGLRELLFGHVLGEPDGWGFLVVGVDGSVESGKTVRRERAEAMFKEVLGRRVWFAAFHGRRASRGAKTVLNVHPLKFRWEGETWYLIHNGTTSMPGSEKLSDSAQLLRAVSFIASQKGEEEAVEVLENGSGFFVWFNPVSRRVWIVDEYRGRDGDYVMREEKKYYVISKHFDEGFRFDLLRVDLKKKVELFAKNLRKWKRKRFGGYRYEYGSRAARYVALYDLEYTIQLWSLGQYSYETLYEAVVDFLVGATPEVWSDSALETLKYAIVYARGVALERDDTRALALLGIIEGVLESKSVSDGVWEVLASLSPFGKKGKKEAKKGDEEEERFSVVLARCTSSNSWNVSACEEAIRMILDSEGKVLSVCWVTDRAVDSETVRNVLRAFFLADERMTARERAEALLYVAECVDLANLDDWLFLAGKLASIVGNKNVRRKLFEKINEFLDFLIEKGELEKSGIDSATLTEIRLSALSYNEEKIARKVRTLEKMKKKKVL